MASLIHELENNEALLLMYMADELPVEDRIEVEQMLASDAGLCTELQRIRSGYYFSMDVLAKLDKNSASLSSENFFAVRQACRAMKQWHVDQLSREPVIQLPARRKIPNWVYAASTAAMLVIGGLIWWGAQNDVTPEPTHQAVASADEDATRLENSFKTDVSPVADAETQANSLTDRSDDTAVASSIFLLDAN